MSRVLMRNVLLLMVIAVIPAAAWADAAGDKVDTLLRDYGSISRDLHKTQLTQSALMKQKVTLDAQGSALSKRQDALNTQANAHNAVAADQQKALEDNKSQCNNKDFVEGKNTPQHINECDNQIKKLNQKSAEVNADVLPLETQQTGLDLEYGQYNQAANDWSVQEQQTMTSLNSLYRALNNWADQADALMGSAPFQDEIEANHADQACAHHALPDGMLSIEELQNYAAGAERCLRYIDTQRRKARATPLRLS